VSRAIALAPIVGILVALWRAEKEQQKQQQLGSTSSSASPSSSFLPSLVSGCGRKLLQDELAYMLTIDWGKAGLEGPTLEEEWADFRQLCKEAEELTSAMEAAEGAAALPEPPDEFVDPITASIMSDPVTLPDSQVTVDRSTVERHLLSQATDPFSRKPLTIAMVVPNTALAARIQRWKATGGKEDVGAA
ncbi:U-box domain-containing protein, partial [Dunaliella salina]